MMKHVLRAGAAIALAAGICGAALAADSSSVAREDFSGTSLRFSLQKDVFNVTVTVSGPNGYYARTFTKSGTPNLNLKKHGKVADGRYRYELTAALEDEFVEVTHKLDSGRGDAGKKKANKSASQNGAFHVVDGEITPVELLSEKEGSDND